MKKFLIYLHEQCAIEDPHDVRTWDKDMSAKFVEKEFLDEKILCSKEKKRKKRYIPNEFGSETKQVGCSPFNYQTKVQTCEKERFHAITLQHPPGELRLEHYQYGPLLTVDPLHKHLGKDCKLVTLDEKNNIKIPSGIIINGNPSEGSCGVTCSLKIFENMPHNISPALKKIIELVKKSRYENRMQNIFLDLENLHLEEHIPSNINIGCITPTSTVFGIMNFADVGIKSEAHVVMKYKMNCIYVAYGYSKIFRFCKWTPRMLDDMLLVAKDNMIQDLNLEFVLHRHCFKLEHARPVIVGRLNSNIKNSFNIYQGLLHFFLKSISCIFHSEQHYILISRYNRKFWVYDPTGRFESMQTDEKHGHPCLIKLDNLCNVTYLLLKLSNLFDNSPFTLSEIGCAEFFEITMRNCDIIKQRLRTAIDHCEPVEDEEIIYDLDEPSEFFIEKKMSEHNEITDMDLSNFNLIYWNHSRFNNAEIVKKFIDQLLMGIHGDSHDLTLEEFINKLIDQLLDHIAKKVSAPEEEAIDKHGEEGIQKPIDNYIELPNSTAIIITNKEVELEMDIFSVNLAFAAVYLEYGKIFEWDGQFLDYIYDLSYKVKSYFQPDQNDVLDLNKFYCSIQIGSDEVGMAFTQLMKIHQDRLKGFLLNLLRKHEILLVLSNTVSFVIIKHQEHYYYFDGKLRDTIEIWEYAQHQIGCITRFNTLTEILMLLSRYNNKKFDYYHIFKVENDTLKQNDFYDDFISVNLYKYHRRKPDGLFKIQGNTCLPNRNIITVNTMRPCYFTSIYIILFIMRLPLSRWTGDIIDLAIKNGPLLQEQIQKTDGTKVLYQKRFIENLAIDGYYFNVFVKEVFEETNSQDILSQLKYYFTKRSILILQFINASFVILKDFGYHVFDPYATLEISQEEEEPFKFEYPEYCYSANNTQAFDDNNQASWIFFIDLKDLLHYIMPRVILNENTKKGYQLWSLNIVSYKRNYNEINRGIELNPDNTNFRNIKYDYDDSLTVNAVVHEHLKWLVDANDFIPIWSRLLITLKRTKIITNSINHGIELQFQWFNFDVERENDIFSIWGTISPRSYVFRKHRNRQYHGIYIVALFILNIYRLSEITSHLIDFIVIEGDRYFNYSVEHITTPDYEVSIDDMVKTYRLGNFQFIWESLKLTCNNGVLYNGQKSLSHAIKVFFNTHLYKYGIIECNQKILAFGVDVEDGYFIYDAQNYGFPLFLDCQGCAYMLRCLSLKRLSYLIVRTFGIYESGHPFVIHALNFDIKLQYSKFYRGIYKKERVFVEKPIRPECMEKVEEPEPEPVEVPRSDPFTATRIS